MFPTKRWERGFDSSQTLDAAFHDGSVDQFWQSHMLEVHDSMGSNPIGTTNGCVDQRQESSDSKSLQCGFESHRIYHFSRWRCSPTGRGNGLKIRKV